MRPRSHFTFFLLVSLAFHALAVLAALFLIQPHAPLEPSVTPVRIVDLPPREARRLPPLRPKPEPPPPPVAERPVFEKPLLPGAVPMPRKFGASEDIRLPKTAPPAGTPEGAEQGRETGKTSSASRKALGPLPFLTQNDIEELARKGMPGKKPGDDSVTLDTDEFKFISYNRWLKVKIESVLRYPELAAISGYQGTLYLKFDILRDGFLGDVEVLKSSGYKILDDEAVRSIHGAAPFQPLPPEWGMERYSIRAAVLFYLSGAYIR